MILVPMTMRSTLLQIFTSSGLDFNLSFMTHSEVVCAFSCGAFLIDLLGRMHCHIDCTCIPFHQCVLSCVLSIDQPVKQHSYIDCYYAASPQGGLLSCASLSYFCEEMHIHTDCICKDFSHVSLNVSSHPLKWNKRSHNECTWIVLRRLPDLHCTIG